MLFRSEQMLRSEMDAHLGYDKHSTMATILSWIDLTDMSFFPELVIGLSKLELSEEKGSTHLLNSYHLFKDRLFIY